MAMLGKRARAPMRRTTSMTGITVDDVNMEAPPPLGPQNPISNFEGVPQGHVMMGPGMEHHRSTPMLSPRYYWRDSGDHDHFLTTCRLCNRRLASGRDIYMYRGDTAFCSQECREQRMKQDERKEKRNMAASETVAAA